MSEQIPNPDPRLGPRSPASEFSWDLFGGMTTFRREVLSVGTTAIEIAPNNPNRMFIYITNLAANIGYIDFTPELVHGQGIRLSPDGGFMSLLIRDDGAALAQAIHGIAALASSTWFLFEVVRVGGGRRVAQTELTG